MTQQQFGARDDAWFDMHDPSPLRTFRQDEPHEEKGPTGEGKRKKNRPGPSAKPTPRGSHQLRTPGRSSGSPSSGPRAFPCPRRHSGRCASRQAHSSGGCAGMAGRCPLHRLPVSPAPKTSERAPEARARYTAAARDVNAIPSSPLFQWIVKKRGQVLERIHHAAPFSQNYPQAYPHPCPRFPCSLPNGSRPCMNTGILR